MHSKKLSPQTINHFSRTLLMACLLYGLTGCGGDGAVDNTFNFTTNDVVQRGGIRSGWRFRC